MCSSSRQFCKGSSGETEGPSTKIDAGFWKHGIPSPSLGEKLPQCAVNAVSFSVELAEKEGGRSLNVHESLVFPLSFDASLTPDPGSVWPG